MTTTTTVACAYGRAVPSARPLKHRPCFIIMGVGESSLARWLWCPCANSSREPAQPSLDQQRCQPGAFAQLAALCSWSHDKLPPGLYRRRSAGSHPPSTRHSIKDRYLFISGDACHSLSVRLALRVPQPSFLSVLLQHRMYDSGAQRPNPA
jgi:hypothetical protein